MSEEKITKKDIKEFLSEQANMILSAVDERFEKVEKNISEFRSEMTEFKDDTLKFQDKALEDLESLKQEKTTGDEQDKRKTKVLEIHNDALKSNKILSEKQISEINTLQAF